MSFIRPCTGKNMFKMVIESGFSDQTYSDFQILVGGRTFHVHRIVLRESDYFGGMLMGGWKEAETGQLELHGEDPLLLQSVLNHVYGIDYHEVLDRYVASAMSQVEGEQRLTVRTGDGRARVTQKTIIEIGLCPELRQVLHEGDSVYRGLSGPGCDLWRYRLEILEYDLRMYVMADKYCQSSLKDSASRRIKNFPNSWHAEGFIATICPAFKRLPPMDLLLCQTFASNLAGKFRGKNFSKLETILSKTDLSSQETDHLLPEWLKMCSPLSSLLREFPLFGQQTLDILERGSGVLNPDGLFWCRACDKQRYWNPVREHAQHYTLEEQTSPGKKRYRCASCRHGICLVAQQRVRWVEACFAALRKWENLAAQASLAQRDRAGEIRTSQPRTRYSYRTS